MKISARHVVKRGKRLTVERRGSDKLAQEIIPETVPTDTVSDVSTLVPLDLAHSIRDERVRRANAAKLLAAIPLPVFATVEEAIEALLRPYPDKIIGPETEPKSRNDFNNDRIDRNSVPSVNPEPIPHAQPEAPVEKGAVRLEDISDEDLLAEVARRNLTPVFVSASNASREQDRPPLQPPTVAPRLWKDRSPGMTPKQFITTFYAPWLEFGVLTRKSIEDCDPALANAYSKRKSENPDEAIALARAVDPRTIADPVAAIENHRAKTRERTARSRNRDKIAHDLK